MSDAPVALSSVESTLEEGYGGGGEPAPEPSGPYQWNPNGPKPAGDGQHVLPGTSAWAMLMLPFRIFLYSSFMCLLYPLLTFVALLRAIYMRLAVGSPSQILNHYPGMHYYDGPIDEAKMRKAVIEVAGEGGIAEENVLFVMETDKVADWPGHGSFPVQHWLGPNAPDKKSNYFDYIFNVKKKKMLRYHVFNATAPGKPTVVYFGGSGNAWDGSSNFNFVREVNNRYAGHPPNKVFQQPELKPESAAKFDEGSFMSFLLKMPVNIFLNLHGFVWNAIRAAKWAGGGGFGLVGNPAITAMNFSNEESKALYNGAKALGVKPFAVMTYAVVKACREVLKESPTCITQQASLQTRHYPVQGEKVGDGRSLVGDWLIGPVQSVGERYELEDAQRGYEELYSELKDVGPRCRDSIWAKAYGLVNSGAALFELLPTYNDESHVCNRSIFMNNYGVRTTPEGSPFHTWNWNAPFWFGFNTINVNGRTTTLVGSMMYGQDTVNVMRDNIEATLRGIMAKGGGGGADVPTYNISYASK